MSKTNIGILLLILIIFVSGCTQQPTGQTITEQQSSQSSVNPPTNKTCQKDYCSGDMRFFDSYYNANLDRCVYSGEKCENGCTDGRCNLVSAVIPTLKKYINDYANILSTSDEEKLNSLASRIETDTTAEVAVLTVQTTQPITIEEYATQTFEKNGIGKKEVDNGLLIVIAVQDRKWRFEVGQGLESILNDTEIEVIGENYLNPVFIEGKYGDGLYNAIEAIYYKIKPEENPLTKLQSDLIRCPILSKSFVCDAFDLSYCGYDKRTTLKATSYPMVGQNGFVPNKIYCRGGTAVGEKPDSIYCGLSTECEQILDNQGTILGWKATFVGAEYGTVYSKIDGKNVYTYTLRRCTLQEELAFDSRSQCSYVGLELNSNLIV